jgi:hypothetical protein
LPITEIESKGVVFPLRSIRQTGEFSRRETIAALECRMLADEANPFSSGKDIRGQNQTTDRNVHPTHL